MYPAAYTIHKMGWHVRECKNMDSSTPKSEDSCVSRGCFWNGNGGGSCEPNLAHQLHQVFKACADELTVADKNAIATVNGFNDADEVAALGEYQWPTDESEMCDMEYERLTCQNLDESTCKGTAGCSYSGGECRGENSDMFWHGAVAELFRTFKENAFPCESYMSQMDCESDGQCYFHLSSCKSHASLVEQALLNSGVSQNSLLFPKLVMMDYDYYCDLIDPDTECVEVRGCTRSNVYTGAAMTTICHVDGAVERADFVDACESEIPNFNLDDFVSDKGPLYVDPEDQPSNADFCAAWAQESECYAIESEAACNAPCFWNVEDGWCGASERGRQHSTSTMLGIRVTSRRRGRLLRPVVRRKRVRCQRGVHVACFVRLLRTDRPGVGASSIYGRSAAGSAKVPLPVFHRMLREGGRGVVRGGGRRVRVH